MRMLRAAALAAAMLAGSAIDQAAEAATYQLVGVTFNDGTTATGNFDFNNIDGFFNVAITTFSTPSFLGTLYTGSYESGRFSGTYLGSEFVDPNAFILALQMDASCLVAGLTCALTGKEENRLPSGNAQRSITEGTVAPIPLPAPAVLLATGLAGVVSLSRRRRKNAVANA